MAWATSTYAADTVISTAETTTQTIAGTGDTLTIDANGSVTVSGIDGVVTNTGITGVTGTNNGTISATNGRGVRLRAADSTFTNNGSLTIAGTTNEQGIRIDHRSTVTNNGTLTVTNSNASSVAISTFFANSADSSITNTGTISVTGGAGIGIQIASNSSNSTVNNSGTVSVTGGGIAVLLRSSGADLTNSGSILATGGGNAVQIDGASTTLTNSGTISATGTSTIAVQGSGNADILNLNQGSRITGNIDLGAGTDTVNFGTNSSATLDIFNVENINLDGGGSNFVQAGNVVTVVDPTGQSVNGIALGSLTTAIHGGVTQHLAQSAPPVQLASTRIGPGMLSSNRRPKVWVKGFGSHRTRGEEGSALAYDHNYSGFVGGYEKNYRQFRVGIMGGYARSNVKTDIISVDNDTKSIFGGGYGQVSFGRVDLSATLLAGYERHDNDRQIFDSLNGVEVAKAKFGSFLLSPSLTLSSEYKLSDRHVFRPSATLVYSVARYDGYTETGTTRSNLAVGDRTSQAVVGRLQLAVEQSFDKGHELELRVGAASRYIDNDDIKGTLSGTSFSYASAGDNTVYGGYMGVNLLMVVTDRLSLRGDLELGKNTGDENYVTGQLGLEFTF